MKGRIVLSLVLTCLLNPCFAMEIQKGNIIEHKEWATGEAKGYLQEGRINKKNDLLQRILRQQAKKQRRQGADAIELVAKIDPLGMEPVFVHSTVDFDSGVSSYIENVTESKQTYFLNTRLCLVKLNPGERDKVEDCFYSQDKIKLDSLGVFSLYKRPTLTYNFSEIGTYYLLLTTTAQSSHSLTLFATEDLQFFSVVDENDL